MTDLRIDGIVKSFGGVQVLKGIDLTIGSGEFFTLLGPSGCGKTTLMRIVAGFLTQDSGEVHLGSERLDTKPAHTRDIGMVFQDYAVFPHLTVADNLAFGLKTRGIGRDEIAARVAEGLKMVRLDGLAERYPAELSGGQQQRVGLARAMVIRPKILLMDEPLSNLDAKLRLELRDDIRDLQKRLAVTTIYVTHDQEEALAISDRICVMNRGVAEQIGTPVEIYRAPRRRFAANFVGTMNFLKATAKAGSLGLGGHTLVLERAVDGPVEIGIRPEHIQLPSPGEGPRTPSVTLHGRITKHTYLGPHSHCIVATPQGDLLVHLTDADESLARTGAEARIYLPIEKLFVFDADGDVSGVRP